MLPLLQRTGYGVEHTFSEAMALRAHQFHLIEADARVLLPSGKPSTIVNRVRGWRLNQELSEPEACDCRQARAQIVANLALDLYGVSP